MLSATFVISVYFISGLILIFFNLFWILAKLFSKLLISASQDRMTEQQGANRKRVGRGLGKNNKRDLEDPDDLLKREISKSFESDNSRGIQKFKGVVDSYDGFSLYTVLYDDGDREQLSTYQIKKRLIIPFTRRIKRNDENTLGYVQKNNNISEIVGHQCILKEKVDNQDRVHDSDDEEQFIRYYSNEANSMDAESSYEIDNMENNRREIHSTIHNSASLPVLEDDPLDTFELLSYDHLDSIAKEFDVKHNSNVSECGVSKVDKRKREEDSCSNMAVNEIGIKNENKNENKNIINDKIKCDKKDTNNLNIDVLKNTSIDTNINAKNVGNTKKVEEVFINRFDSDRVCDLKIINTDNANSNECVDIKLAKRKREDSACDKYMHKKINFNNTNENEIITKLTCDNEKISFTDNNIKIENIFNDNKKKDSNEESNKSNKEVDRYDISTKAVRISDNDSKIVNTDNSNDNNNADKNSTIRLDSTIDDNNKNVEIKAHNENNFKSNKQPNICKAKYNNDQNNNYNNTENSKDALNNIEKMDIADTIIVGVNNFSVQAFSLDDKDIKKTINNTVNNKNDKNNINANNLAAMNFISSLNINFKNSVSNSKSSKNNDNKVNNSNNNDKSKTFYRQ